MELQPRKIDDDEYVTQYGSRSNSPVFWDRPRPKDEGELSVTLGRLTPAEIRSLVRTAGVPTSDDGARYARAGDLRAQDFEVIHKPSKRNPDHAVIRYPIEGDDTDPREWDDTVAGIFNENFGAPVWYRSRREAAR